MEEKILEEEDIEGMINLLQSSDTDSSSMGLMVLENCDQARSLPWLLIIFRMVDFNTRVLIYKSEQSQKVWDYLSKTLKIDTPPKAFTTQHIYDIVKSCANSEAAIAYIERDYAKKLKKQMIEWGYSFLEDYELTLTRNDDTRQE